jgi:hypothetical protein
VNLLQPFPCSTRISLVSDFLARYGLSRPQKYHKMSDTAVHGAFASLPKAALVPPSQWAQRLVYRLAYRRIFRSAEGQENLLFSKICRRHWNSSSLSQFQKYLELFVRYYSGRRVKLAIHKRRVSTASSESHKKNILMHAVGWKAVRYTTKSTNQSTDILNSTHSHTLPDSNTVRIANKLFLGFTPTTESSTNCNTTTHIQ